MNKIKTVTGSKHTKKQLSAVYGYYVLNSAATE